MRTPSRRTAALTQAAAGGLLTNDTGAGIAETGIVTPPAGSVAVSATGSFVYTPVADYSGPDSFTYRISDEYGRTTTATVAITVNPVALDVTGSGPGPGAIQLTPTTPIGTGPFTYHLVTTPSAADGVATMNVNTGVITFTPAAGFHGNVPLFTYDVTDGDADVSAPANIDLSVGIANSPDNDGPERHDPGQRGDHDHPGDADRNRTVHVRARDSPLRG